MILKKALCMNRKLRFFIIFTLWMILPACTQQPHTQHHETPTPTSQLGSTALVKFESHDFSGSGDCSICHTGLRDENGNDISIDTHWRATMMANAAKDPLWQAKVSSEVAKHPELQPTIEEICATCHMPMAYTQAVADRTGTIIQEEGFINSNNALHAAAMDGVSCALCHQIEDAGLGEQHSFSGQYQIDTRTEAPNRLIYGPFPDPVGMVMEHFLGFKPVEGPHITESELCATCHTLYTPYLDAEGNIVGTFPEQTPYLEWQHSVYGPEKSEELSCQGCHMPAADSAALIANRPRGGQLKPRSPFSQHHFVGGNTTMLKMLRDNAEDIRVTANDEHFEATLTRAESQLQSAADVSIQDITLEHNTLNLQVNIDVHTGHKFPSGFPSRRAWIHLTIIDADGEIAFESGPPQPDGSIGGANADSDLATYEPHYDTITAPDQVQIYESIMRNTENEVTYTLLRGAGYIKDNRLLPRGFDKTQAHVDIAPYGQATTDETFTGGHDEVTYQINVQGHQSPFNIKVELLYQSLSYPSIQDLRNTDTDRVKKLGDYYDAVDKMPIMITRAESKTD